MKKIITLLAMLVCFQAKSQFDTLLVFEQATTGRDPLGSFVSDGTYLYGMTSRGGTGPCIVGCGTIFKIKPNGTGYTKLYDFLPSPDGAGPMGSLYYDGTYLYGTTSGSGLNYDGTIFKIKLNGTGYLKIFDFASATTGSQPEGSLISDGNFLYGTTRAGGTNNLGTIFKIKPDGTAYTKLYDFINDQNGCHPQGSLTYDGTYLYGTTYNCGTNYKGVIFKIMPNGTNIDTVMSFNGANGSYYNGDLISDGTFLYGMSGYGGTNNLGTIYRVKPDGSSYLKLLDFMGSTNGSKPYGSLISDGTFLYGVAGSGGSGNSGIIFKIKSDGSGFVNLYDFNCATDGAGPTGALIADGNYLYGMATSGCGADSTGTAFRFQYATGGNCTPSVSYTLTQNVAPHTWDAYPNYSSNVTNARWDWGDGTSSVSLYPSHVYSAPGRYNICVTAFAACGDSLNYCQNDTVYRMANYTSSTMVYINILNPTTSIYQKANNIKINIYPNPTSDQFFIEANTPDKLNVDLYDVNGRQVFSASVRDKENINVATLDNGAYTLTIKTADRVINKKLFILR